MSGDGDSKVCASTCISCRNRLLRAMRVEDNTLLSDIQYKSFIPCVNHVLAFVHAPDYKYQAESTEALERGHLVLNKIWS